MWAYLPGFGVVMMVVGVASRRQTFDNMKVDNDANEGQMKVEWVDRHTSESEQANRDTTTDY
jgi:hypothetical protein